MAYSGRFAPKRPEKYEGNASNIIYRSLWERKFMEWCDNTTSVLKWQSEELFILYRDPTRDGKVRRYFPDFLITVAGVDGNPQKIMIEVKPKKQTVKPVPGKKSRKLIREIMDWGTNSAKWEAATSYCLDRGWTFKIITEDDLDIGKAPKPFKKPHK